MAAPRRLFKSVFVVAVVTVMLTSLTSLAVADDVGLVDPASGQWHLYDDAGVPTTSFYFGNPGDLPFMGDWNGDGIETPGLYRQSDGYVYLRNSNTQGVADIRFFFGNPGDVPIAGDFDGDGFDTVSIYRPSNQTFYIINKLGANDGGLGVADLFYIFGNPGDKPFVGDFDGDGVETVGLHRESTGLVYFRNSHTQGAADSQFIFGDPGDRLVAGDWNADGRSSPALFRPSDTTMYFRYTNTQGNADGQFAVGSASWLPVAGFWESAAVGSDPSESPDGGADSSGAQAAGADEDTSALPGGGHDTTGEVLADVGPVSEAADDVPPDAQGEAAGSVPAQLMPLTNSQSIVDNADEGPLAYPGEPVFASVALDSSYGFRSNYLGTAMPQVGQLYMSRRCAAFDGRTSCLGRGVGDFPSKPDSKCSATLVARDLIITAAHCVLPPRDGNVASPLGYWWDGWAWSPGLNGGSAPYGSWTTVRGNDTTFVPAGWVHNASGIYSGRAVYDYALLKLQRNSSGRLPGDDIPWFSPAWNTEQLNLAKYSVGYPVDGVFSGSPTRQWYCSSSHGTHNGRYLGQDLRFLNNGRFAASPPAAPGDGWHTMGLGCNANGGMSGGPIFAYVPSLGGWYVVSVNSTMTHGSRSTYLRNLWGSEFRGGQGIYGFDALWEVATGG